MRSSRTRTILATTIAGVAVVAMQAAPSHAAETDTTFTLTGGGVSITTSPSSANLSAGTATGSATLSGSLGNIKVTDARGALGTGWTVTAEATDFITDADLDDTIDTGESVADDSVRYTAVAGAVNGVVTPVGSTLTAIADTATVMSGTAVVGNNDVTWNPTITITLPSNAVAGVYEGTITHSMA